VVPNIIQNKVRNNYSAALSKQMNRLSAYLAGFFVVVQTTASLFLSGKEKRLFAVKG